MPVNTMTVLNMSQHRTFANQLIQNRRDRAFIYWTIGRQLNLEYGSPDSAWIPGSDMETLTALYGVPPNYVTAMRRFANHPDSDNVTRAKRTINAYRSWSGIITRFLRGLPADAPVPAQRNAAQPARGFVVPEAAVDQFAVKFGWSHAMAQRAMREYSRDTAWLVSIFETRARRDGHRPVSSG